MSAQCENKVTHLSDTATINEILVTVSSFGDVSELSEGCSLTGPYLVGNDLVTPHDNGGYIFHFSPPIDFLSLNFSAINNTNIGSEIIKIFVNGDHYSVPSIETPINCSPNMLAILTPFGNITTQFSDSFVGGTEDISIPGPISSLTVLDSIVFGSPFGVGFSLFICDKVLTSISETKDLELEIFPNPANDKLMIKGVNQNKINMGLYDILGYKLEVDSTNKTNGIEIDVSHLIEGVYFLMISSNGKYQNYKILIN